MGGEGAYSVAIRRTETVAAALPLQEHWLPMSNLDLLLPPLDFGVFMCFRKPSVAAGGDAFVWRVGVLKKSLAEALLTYYPFAGEVVRNSVGEPELLCNNRGVDFLEAVATVELSQVDFHNPDESVQGKLVPVKKQGVFSVQATELACGGMVVGCSIDHRVADAHSLDMFLHAWTRIAQQKSVTVTPSFRRSVLYPRRPMRYDESVGNLYLPISAMPRCPGTTDDHLISRIYYIPYEAICRLQTEATGEHSVKATKLESFTAFLWKMVAESSSGGIANGRRISRMGVVVDGRPRLGAMENYFGNVLSVPYGEKGIGELAENPLTWVADTVREFVENAATRDHFLSLIDWVESQRPQPAVAKVYCTAVDDGPATVVSSGMRLPVADIDFGWGRPFFGSYHFPWGGDCGYVMPMPSPARKGDWLVYMLLKKSQLLHIEANSNVLRAVSFEYLTQ